MVYPFFAHYRNAINRKLNESKHYRYLFVGDRMGKEEIKEWNPSGDISFLETRSVTVKGLLFQSGLVRLAFRKDVSQIIFLGDAHYATTWLSAALARLTGKRVWFWTHGWTHLDKGLKGMIRLVFYRLAHGLLLYGHHAKEIGIRVGFRQEAMHVIYNSLDYPNQVAMRESVREEDLTGLRASLFGPLANSPTLICTGRLIPMRRLDILLEAMLQLTEEKKAFNLLLVGDGPEAVTLKKQAHRRGLSLHFFGPCYDESLLAMLFMASDMLVMPGRIGLAAIHSLAYGTPVLTHDDPNDQHPEWEAIIPGFNGAYFARNNSRDLARVLGDWFSHPPDRAVIRQRCYEIVERFYNPVTQAELIERALNGAPAHDSEWEAFRHARRARSAWFERVNSCVAVRSHKLAEER